MHRRSSNPRPSVPGFQRRWESGWGDTFFRHPTAGRTSNVRGHRSGMCPCRSSVSLAWFGCFPLGTEAKILPAGTIFCGESGPTRWQAVRPFSLAWEKLPKLAIFLVAQSGCMWPPGMVREDVSRQWPWTLKGHHNDSVGQCCTKVHCRRFQKIDPTAKGSYHGSKRIPLVINFEPVASASCATQT